MSFTVSKNGDNLLYISHPHGIWITFDQYGDVKLGVSAQYAGKIDGLCGFFNNEKSDDKRKPTGEIAHSTVEFGNAWSVSTTNNDQDCEPHVCPKVLQDEAWTICNKVNDEIFKPCHASVDPTKFISRCLETACDCLLTSTNGSSSSLPSSISDLEKLTKTCKCSMLKNYVVECLAADDSISLETWRSVHSCEATCPSPFIHQDCFRRKCETTCSNLQSSDCGIVSGSCFSGCYCPSGSVREGSTCIPMSECRDCVCDGFGKSQYLTYDRKNFTFDGNCTYLLTRDVTIENVHTFEIYTTIGPCLSNSSLNKATCTQAFHIAFGSHIIHIQKISTSSTKALDITVDGLKVNNLPFNQDWIKMNIHSKELKILFPQSQVEVSSIFESMTFSVSKFSLV
jgi:von Willebrand factor